MLEPSTCNPPFITTNPVLSPTPAGSIINDDGPFICPVIVIFPIFSISLFESTTNALDADAVPSITDNNCVLPLLSYVISPVVVL